ncbi:MAG: amidohydrolase family protein [Acidobacteria bacterium]|nr:amidohydrolase family protein [Acidobacteriota bacterium]
MRESTRILRHTILLLFAATATLSLGQARPFPSSDEKAIYDRILPQIEQIKIWDMHGHPGFPDDPDVDAMAAPPGSEALRVRDDNPELVTAAKALFGYPFDDLSPEHQKWLINKKDELKKQRPGVQYFDSILDAVGIETAAANRVAIPAYLDPARFRWVFFVDNFMFPFDNRALRERNGDQQVYIPLQEKVLKRNMQQAGVSGLPTDISGYEQFMTKVLEQNKAKGAFAEKFEAAYFRSLHFLDPPRERAAAIYAKYRAGGAPTSDEYRDFQDYVFRYLVREGGRLQLEVHVHTDVGIGDYFNLSEGNVMQLENVLRDPRYDNTVFVLIHGGYPYDRQSIWLAARKNVYLDSSLTGLLLYPSEFKHVLKQWLEIFPDKVVFGSDCFPYNAALGAEESYWLAVKSAQTSVAAALAEMVASGEINEARALQFAHMYLHDTSARLNNNRGSK